MTRLRRHAILLLATSAIAAPGSANTILFSTGTTGTGRLQPGTPPQGSTVALPCQGRRRGCVDISAR